MGSLSVETVVIIGTFFVLLSFAGLVITLYTLNFARRRDAYYKTKIEAIVKVSEINAEVQRELIEEIKKLIQTLNETDSGYIK